MAVLRRLSNSCMTVTSDAGTTLLDPGFFTFDSGEVDLDTIGEVQQVLITHAHADHVKPEFVQWLIDRGTDVRIHANADVARLLAKADIEVLDTTPANATAEDLFHEALPHVADPVTNRAWTVDGVLTHPGDSFGLTTSAEVLALPLMAPWTSTTDAVAFARRVAPRIVVPIHDFYLTPLGRTILPNMASAGLEADGIEVLALGWGQSATI